MAYRNPKNQKRGIPGKKICARKEKKLRMDGKRWTCEAKGRFCLIYQMNKNDYCKKCFEIEIAEKKKAQAEVSEIIKNAKINKEHLNVTTGKISAVWKKYDTLHENYMMQNDKWSLIN